MARQPVGAPLLGAVIPCAASSCASIMFVKRAQLARPLLLECCGLLSMYH